MKVIKTADLMIDLNQKTVWKGEKKISLQMAEYVLLIKLVTNPKQIILQDNLLKAMEIYYRRDMSQETLRSHIYRLRSRLGTYKGEGYIDTKISF